MSSASFPSSEAAIEAAKARERDGEMLTAHEIAYEGALAFPASALLKYLAVRTLARAGGTGEALKLYRDWQLDQDPGEDARAVRGRLAKDSAMRRRGPARIARFIEAARAYEDAYRATAGSFSGVNAAAMWFLAGQQERAAALVEPVRAASARERPNGALGLYYHHATLAELALLADDDEAAQRHLEEAAAIGIDDLAARATTRRQLRLICAQRGIDDGWLQVLRLPIVAHYLGHRIEPPGGAGRFEAAQETAVAAGIDAWIRQHDARFFYGALASGADILFAEAALARPRGELHIVLPFGEADFIEASVRSSGEEWVRRFESCLDRARSDKAHSVTFGTEGGYGGDEALFPYGARLAMGLAVLRGQRLGTEVRQVAVWDGRPATGAAGTAVDVERWQAGGRVTDVIDLPMTDPPAAHRSARPHASPHREIRAILYGDFQGFSGLKDEDMPRFNDLVMAAVGEVIASFGPGIDHRNSWGDAIYLTFAEVGIAARCALALQRRVSTLDLGTLTPLPLRLAGHIGPVWRSLDHIRSEPTWLGANVTRAARLEPKTIPGQVYVTEPFAAALALDAVSDISCEFVGTRPGAKDFGPMRMYRLISTTDAG